MNFELRHDFATAPRVMYDGIEAYQFTLGRIAPDLPQVALDVTRPEATRWRHYYTTPELNALCALLNWRMIFVLNREWAYHPHIERQVYLYPLLIDGTEWTLSYAYDERSPGRFTYWLAAVLVRPQTQRAFEQRVAQIEKYWL